MSRVLVTGAFGNLGQLVVRELVSRGHHVVVLGRDKPANRRRAATLGGDVVWGDVRSADFGALVADVDAVIHLAGVLPPVTEREPELAEAINVDATLRLVDAVERAPRSPLLVYPSSVTVFGLPTLPVPRAATDPVRPSDTYTRHKVTIEERLRAGGTRHVILRVGVSVDRRTLRTDPATFRQLLRTAPDNPLEYVHPADVARAIANAIDTPAAVGRTLLIGGGPACQVTQHEFMSAALEAAGIRLPRDLMGSEPFYTHWMDTAEAEEVLRFQTRTFADYRAELRTALRWVRPVVRPVAPLVVAALRRWVRAAAPAG